MKNRLLSVSIWTLILLFAASWMLYVHPEILFNSDNIYPYALAVDILVHHHSLAAWNLNNAPSFFPDLCIYYLYWKIIPDRAWTFFLFGMTNLILGAILFRAVFVRFLSPDHPRQRQVGAAAMALFLGFGAMGTMDHALYHMTFIGHFGVVLSSLALLLILLSRFPEVSRLRMFFAFAVIVATVVSDRLLLPVFVLPMALSSAWVWMTACPEKSVRVGILRVFGVSVFGGLAGVWGFALLNRFLSIQQIERHMGLSLVKHAAHMMLLTLKTEAARASNLVFLLLVLAGGIVLAFQTIKSKNPLQRMVLGFLILSCAAGITAPIATGLFVAKDSWRYSLNLFFFAWFGVALYFTVPRRRAVYAGAAAISIFVLISWVKHVAVSSRTEETLFSYKPSAAECLDSLYTSGKIRGGLAYYWISKSLRFFTAHEVPLVQVMPPFIPFHWADNLEWYPLEQRGGTLPLNFVIANGLDPVQIEANLGKPSHTVECPGASVWIYEEAESLYRLNHFFDGKKLDP